MLSQFNTSSSKMFLPAMILLLAFVGVTSSSPTSPTLAKRVLTPAQICTPPANKAMYYCGATHDNDWRKTEQYAQEYAEMLGLETVQMVTTRNNGGVPYVSMDKSRLFAENSSGKVYLFEGNLCGNLDGVWKRTEEPALERNPRVTALYAIDPAEPTLDKRVWHRNAQGAIVRDRNTATGQQSNGGSPGAMTRSASPPRATAKAAPGKSLPTPAPRNSTPPPAVKKAPAPVAAPKKVAAPVAAPKKVAAPVAAPKKVVAAPKKVAAPVAAPKKVPAKKTVGRS